MLNWNWKNGVMKAVDGYKDIDVRRSGEKYAWKVADGDRVIAGGECTRMEDCFTEAQRFLVSERSVPTSQALVNSVTFMHSHGSTAQNEIEDAIDAFNAHPAVAAFRRL